MKQRDVDQAVSLDFLRELTLPEIDRLLNQLSQFDRTMTLSEFLDALLDYRELVTLTSTQ